jgi:hypothetical protein
MKNLLIIGAPGKTDAYGNKKVLAKERAGIL